jgi:hypothetical protein
MSLIGVPSARKDLGDRHEAFALGPRFSHPLDRPLLLGDRHELTLVADTALPSWRSPNGLPPETPRSTNTLVSSRPYISASSAI